MKTILIISIFAITFLRAASMEYPEAILAVLASDNSADTTVYLTADKMPEIVGGVNALASKIIYPEEAKMKGIEGIVYISAVVDENGAVRNPEVLKSAGELLDNSAMKAFTQLKFIAGEKDGKKVKVKITLPIAYKLDRKPDAPKGNNPADKSESGINTKAEVMPEIEGGMAALAKNIVYPNEAKENNIQGKVFVSAVIDENGNVISAKVIKGIGYGCDESAVEAVKKTKFTPAKDKGKNVKVQITIPIMYALK